MKRPRKGALLPRSRSSVRVYETTNYLVLNSDRSIYFIVIIIKNGALTNVKIKQHYKKLR